MFIFTFVDRESQVIQRSLLGCVVASFFLFSGAEIHATLIQGQFSGTVSRAGLPFAGDAGSPFSGTYSYDDSAAPLGPGPGSFLQGTLYPALSYEIDGVPVGATAGIVIIDGTLGTGADGFYVLNLTNGSGYPALGLSAAGGLWSGIALSVMDGRVFSDFGSTGLVASSPGPSNLPSGSVTSWSQSPVPEPTTGVLLALGMLGLGAQRRLLG